MCVGWRSYKEGEGVYKRGRGGVQVVQGEEGIHTGRQEEREGIIVGGEKWRRSVAPWRKGKCLGREKGNRRGKGDEMGRWESKRKRRYGREMGNHRGKGIDEGKRET